MMVERHYDEEALIAILHSGEDAVSGNAHLSSCASCTDTMESYRKITATLREEEVWSLRDPHEEGAARGAAALRAVAAALENEDNHAKGLVEQVLTSPRQWWTATVISDERYQSAGVARRLIELSESKIDAMPPDAVELAAAAIAITDIIDGGESLLQLRGAAYRQHAYALFYIGDFPRALESVDRAQQIFESCAVSEYALARVDIVRSLVYGGQERYTEALEISRRAARTFRTFGDIQRLVSAMMSEAYLLMNLRNLRDALPLLLEIEREYGNQVDLDTRARTFSNIAACQWNIGQFAQAVQYFQLAAALYDECGTATEAARVRYNLAVLLATQGKHSDARKRLFEVQREFENLGMPYAVVVTGLDLAEIALLENNFKEVEELCRAAMRQFEAGGLAHSSEALTALTFLREAAEQRRATQEIVWHVKTYIRRLPNEPALLFAPAPLPPA